MRRISGARRRGVYSMGSVSQSLLLPSSGFLLLASWFSSFRRCAHAITVQIH